jgi:hypothetical protein
MNTEKFNQFSKAYEQGLREAIEIDQEKAPEDREYTYEVHFVPIVLDRMLKAIQTNPRGVNYTCSKGFKRACKLLGIKHTVKSIFQYLEIE